MKRQKQNHKISFHFLFRLAAGGLGGAAKKMKGNFGFCRRAERAPRRAEVGVATRSARKMKFEVTTRAARGLFVKILRILLIQCSNFVQKTPQTRTQALRALACERVRNENRGGAKPDIEAERDVGDAEWRSRERGRSGYKTRSETRESDRIPHFLNHTATVPKQALNYPRQKSHLQ